MAEKKLEVKDLTISFRTSAGKVQAVRKISFDLYKGETLAIVGESGSGKSVTSKAIIGILAGNSIVEDGEILYDGQDLLKIDEEDFHKLRGNKISMIFQDPMSSLNPIVKIGKQLTEAMVLKGRSRQKECRKLFNSKLALLQENLLAVAESEEEKAQAKKLCYDFNKFETVAIKLEKAYNIAHSKAAELSEEIPEMLFEIEHNTLSDAKETLKEVVQRALLTFNEFVVDARQEEMKNAALSLKSKVSKAIKEKAFGELAPELQTILDICKEATSFTKPNFFAMGYYLTFSGNDSLPEYTSVEELNSVLEQTFEEGFHGVFNVKAQAALSHAYKESVQKKQEALAALAEFRKLIDVEGELDEAVVMEQTKSLYETVKAAINYIELKKDSREFTFVGSLKSLLNRYFKGHAYNAKEQKRFDKDTAKINRILAKGKVPEWKPVPPSYVDFALTKKNILNLIDGLTERLLEKVHAEPENDYVKLTEEFIEFLRENASGVVNKVTKAMARVRAIKVMKEVGIPEARKRYYQYPFEFSGGMRQRIVIAIALVSNPDILICDEPTTALDVTIQANILELINKLKKERQLSIIFITHDLGVVANMADHVAVMYAGKIVEYGSSEDIFYHPAHPYTWALLSSIPDLETSNTKLDAIPGTPPNMIYPPVGDAFAERNKYAMQIDFEEQPPMFEAGEGHYAATWLLHPDAPKVTPPDAVVKRAARHDALKAKLADAPVEEAPVAEAEGGQEDGK